MKTNSVTARGSRNGATFMPIPPSTWARICDVKASKNSWTEFGLPEDNLARTKNASAITTKAANEVPMMVSRLKDMPRNSTTVW